MCTNLRKAGKRRRLFKMLERRKHPRLECLWDKLEIESAFHTADSRPIKFGRLVGMNLGVEDRWDLSPVSLARADPFPYAPMPKAPIFLCFGGLPGYFLTLEVIDQLY